MESRAIVDLRPAATESTDRPPPLLALTVEQALRLPTRWQSQMMRSPKRSQLRRKQRARGGAVSADPKIRKKLSARAIAASLVPAAENYTRQGCRYRKK